MELTTNSSQDSQSRAARLLVLDHSVLEQPWKLGVSLFVGHAEQAMPVSAIALSYLKISGQTRFMDEQPQFKETSTLPPVR
jgi:hypothetical protein